MDKLYICSVCKKYKPFNAFSKCTHNINRDMRNYTCKECYKIRYGENRKNIHDSDLLESLLKVRIHDAQVRAKKKNIYIDITLEHLKELWNKQEGKCALTKFPMTTYLYNGKRNPYNLSIDRIDSSKGYEIGNVQLVCSMANMMKGEFSMKELKKFCEAIIKS